MARVSFVDLENPDEHNRINRAADQALFGSARVINSGRITAHVPLIARFLTPLMASLQRNGAGSILPAKVKAIVDIKTSVTNNCAY